jgi:hypothetical protein
VSAPTLRGALPLGIVEKDLSHGGGCHGQEVWMALPLRRRLVHESQIGLVDQGGCIERLLSRPVLSVLLRDLVKLTIDQRKQLGKGLSIPCLQLVKETSHCLLGSVTHVGGFSHEDTDQRYAPGGRSATKRPSRE